ncbi:MAG TPA: DUF421 domain-containing protein [Deltaproteobacteria bacterium]|nr:DUF421 domain-containing protein [Deltaproteobacteria bacterium]HQJ08954.1 DUF421 domain-containing protein [Deltaproteobacteria bacterium]
MRRFFDIDWNQLLTPTMSLGEVILRGTMIYWFIFLLIRFVMKREASPISIADLLVIVIIADAAQNAMAGSYQSVTEGAVLIVTIFFWNYAIDWLGYHFSFFNRLQNLPPLLLVKNGSILKDNLRKELITNDELMSKLREKGVTDLSQISEVYMESDGQISIIQKK